MPISKIVQALTPVDTAKKINELIDDTNNYELPVASATLGAVKSGTDIIVDGLGNVNVNNSSHVGGFAAEAFIFSSGPENITPLLPTNADTLGGVPADEYLKKTGDNSNTTSVFVQSSVRENIVTGEKVSVVLGKVKKWFTDLGALAFKSTVSKSDLASEVQVSLDKAEAASAVPEWAKQPQKPTYSADEVGAVPVASKGVANGVASLDANGKIPASQLPTITAVWG
ncbi:MAG: hypothetical protein RR365_00880 [Bacteroides sp.]